MVTQESYKGGALCFILIVVCCTIFVGQLNQAIIIGKFGTGQSKTPRLILTRQEKVSFESEQNAKSIVSKKSFTNNNHVSLCKTPQ